MDAESAPTQGQPDPEAVDVRQVPVDRLLEQVAAELAMVAAAHLGLLPGTQDGRGDPGAARMALDAGGSIVEVLRAAGGGPAADDLRRTYADLMLAFAEMVPSDGAAGAPAGPDAPASPPSPPPPPRPSIWTPGGEV